MRVSKIVRFVNPGRISNTHEERSGGSNAFEIEGRMGWPR
jgi:hypothetical protein